MTDPNIEVMMPVAIAWETGDGWVWKRLGATGLFYTLAPGESGMIRAIPVAPGAVVQLKPIMGQAATAGGKLTATVIAFPLA